jgi:hypothetical protein
LTEIGGKIATTSQVVEQCILAIELRQMRFPISVDCKSVVAPTSLAFAFFS